MSSKLTGSSSSHVDSDELPDIDEPTSKFPTESNKNTSSDPGPQRNMNRFKLPPLGVSNQSSSVNMEMPEFGSAGRAKSPTAAQGQQGSNVVVLSSDSDEEIPACQSWSEAPRFATPNPSADKMTYQDFVLRYMDKEGFLTVTAMRDMLNGMSKRLSQASAETFSLTLLSMDEQSWAQNFLVFNGYDRGVVRQYWDSALVHRLRHESREMLSPILGENSRICLETLRRVANVYSDSVARNRKKSFTPFLPFESESTRRKSSSSSDSCPTPRKTPMFTTGNNSESSFDEFNSSSSSSRGTPSTSRSRSFLPKTYHHNGNTKRFYQNQRHFEIMEDLHIARSVLQLSAELTRDGQTSDAILDFVRSDNWDFRTENHQSLKDRVNELNSTNGYGKRTGTSLKGRWKKIVSYITSGNEELPFLNDASIDAQGFKKIVNRYHRVAVNSRANRKSASGN